MNKPAYPNVLALRYATPEMINIWTEQQKIIFERRLWMIVLITQRELGYPVDPSDIDAYERVLDQVDLASIAARELELRHDIKAHIEEFNAIAGGRELIHLGMTSRDLTENVEQMQILRSLELIRDRLVATLLRLAARATQLDGLVVAGRSHNVPAQLTTLGKRFANAAEELLFALQKLEELIDSIPLRGIKGPMGTSQDQLDLLGSTQAVAQLEAAIREDLGFRTTLDSVGQVYPRSFDLAVVQVLELCACGPSSLATTIRLMAGQELASEGFKKGQVGSTAMPHKMNARTSERVNGLHVILGGYTTMLGAVAGNQWNEGDVSCSVVRRIALPDAFLALDGLLQSFMTVLDEFGPYPKVIRRELDRYLPFLATTAILADAVKRGRGREEAHAAIKEHSLAVVEAMRNGRDDNDLFNRLLNDERIAADFETILDIQRHPIQFTGLAVAQVQAVVARIEAVAARYPEAAAYAPDDIL